MDIKLNQKLILFILVFLSCFNNSIAKENKILLKVNNNIITSVDILNEIKFLSFINKEFLNIEKNQQIQIAKNSLIKEKVKSIEILKFQKNLYINDKNFENIIKNFFQNQKIENLVQFKILLDKNNLDFDFVKKKISVDTFWKGLIYEKFHTNVKVDKAEIKKNILNQEKQTEYLLSEIVFTLNKEDKFNEKFEKIKNMIKEKNFAEAAFNFSISDTSGNGGELGWIKENVLNKKINKELKIINNGEFTSPIVIPGGFLILHKTNSRETKKNLDINNEMKNIIDRITNDQLNRFSNIYLNKLRKNTQIYEL